MAGAGIDPFTIGLLSMFAGQNPEQAAPLLDSMGVPVPQLPSTTGIPVTVPGTAPQQAPAQPAVAGSLQQAQPQAAGSNPLSVLAGVKAPAPVQPIMNGGVTGGVKAPEVASATKVGSPAIDALMAALLGRSPTPQVPTLGDYIKGLR